jgi:hypothetical protein
MSEFSKSSRYTIIPKGEERAWTGSGWLFRSLTANDPVRPETENEQRVMDQLYAGHTVEEIVMREAVCTEEDGDAVFDEVSSPVDLP